MLYNSNKNDQSHTGGFHHKDGPMESSHSECTIVEASLGWRCQSWSRIESEHVTFDFPLSIPVDNCIDLPVWHGICSIRCDVNPFTAIARGDDESQVAHDNTKFSLAIQLNVTRLGTETLKSRKQLITLVEEWSGSTIRRHAAAKRCLAFLIEIK